jgi:hypothetical protein
MEKFGVMSVLWNVNQAPLRLLIFGMALVELSQEPPEKLSRIRGSRQSPH